MYRIIGADGKEYGPVSLEDLRQWIKDGRVNAHTRMRAEGGADWKTAAEFPEVAPFVGSSAEPARPPQAPLIGTAEAEALANQIIARGYRLEIGRCFSRGWELTMRHFWLTVGAGLLITVASTAAGAIPFGGLLLNYVLWGGYDWLLLKLARGQRAEVGDAFAGFSRAFVPLMLFSLVAQLLSGIGFLFCILPGIYLVVCWLLFGPLLILDKRIDFWPAMECARKVVSHHWWQMFGFCIVCLLVALLGLLLCGIGFFIAVPVISAATVYAYEDIFGATNQPSAPATPSPAAGEPPSI